eukprot:scaffold7624_cov248-Pinguiococcus_pyrenoidosus.AAC.7
MDHVGKGFLGLLQGRSVGAPDAVEHQALVRGPQRTHHRREVAASTGAEHQRRQAIQQLLAQEAPPPLHPRQSQQWREDGLHEGIQIRVRQRQKLVKEPLAQPGAIRGSGSRPHPIRWREVDDLREGVQLRRSEGGVAKQPQLTDRVRPVREQHLHRELRPGAFPVEAQEHLEGSIIRDGELGEIQAPRHGDPVQLEAHKEVRHHV